MMRVSLMPVVRTVFMLLIRLGWQFLGTPRKYHVNLRRPHTAAIDRLDIYPHFRKAEPRWKATEPGRGSARRQQGSEQHVSADPGSRVKYGKTTIRHRVRICLLQELEANLGASRLPLWMGCFQVIENALSLSKREARHGCQLGHRRRPHAGKAAEALQQTPPLGRADAGDGE